MIVMMLIRMASITVRDFINERKRKGHSDRVLIRDLDKIIKNAKKEQEMMKRRKARIISEGYKIFVFFSKSKKLIILIYKLIIIIKNRSFQVTSAKESRCLYNPFGESILPQDSFWFMVKSLQEVSVLCDLTNVLYSQNFIPSLQSGNLKEKGLKHSLHLKIRFPHFRQSIEYLLNFPNPPGNSTCKLISKVNLLGQQPGELEGRFLEYQYSAEDEEDPFLIQQFSSQRMVPFYLHL
ncbi:hypothetical protein Anas_06232 [Armadillidium nasatum]|uniref:Uncharacterized protein n=1 Tax=Armadillidium nasatum TaxID=96803 RepID=A0A5N5SNF2_9CRUS|nr:hypothetical protein Anas_06232 [Armadillidium nasatum]